YLPLQLHRHHAHQGLHSFPTRRSSDLRRCIASIARVMGPVAANPAHAPVNRSFTAGTPSRVLSVVNSLRELTTLPYRCTPNIGVDRKSTRLNSSHVAISYAVFCLKKKK